MPDTFLGLALFLALLAPGICFVLIREARVPQRDLSALRETALIGLVSFAADSLVLILFGIFRSIWPELTPDISALISDPKTYISSNLARLGWWGLGLLLAACGLAILAAAQSALDRVSLGPIRFVSAWYRLFHAEGTEKYCGCFLDDGSWVAGFVASYSTDVEETGDRDLVLSAPIYYRAEGQDEKTTLTNVSAFVISANHIVGMQFHSCPWGPQRSSAQTQESDGPARRRASGTDRDDGPTPSQHLMGSQSSSPQS